MEWKAPIYTPSITTTQYRLGWFRLGTILIGILIGGFTPSKIISATTQSHIPLFIDAQGHIPPSISQALPPPQLLKRWVKRHRTMQLNPDAINLMTKLGQGEQPDLTLDLFDGKTHVVDLEPPRAHRKQTRVWRGRLRGEAESDVTLVAQGTTMTGTILSDNRLYKLESDGKSFHRLVEIDPEALPNDHHPIVVERDDPSLAPAVGEPAPSTDSTAAATAGTVVDVLVVYSTSAKNQEGGQAAIEALITLGVDMANQAYSNSQIDLQLQLIHTAEVSYVESGSIDTDLTRLRSTTDGIMDEVHQLRERYQADLVTLIVDNGGGFCGIAYVMANGPRASFASSAFSVTARDCVANNTLAHEMGHNMGNAHDRATGGTGVYTYSYGYRDEGGRFRTIMAYPCPSVSCPRVKYFSNPRILINGRPAGIDPNVDPANSADNARSMNEVRQIVAAWRSGIIDVTPPAAPTNLRFISP